jgi:signal transduction histidine kinase
VRVNHVHLYYAKGEKQERHVDIIASPIKDNKDNVIAVIELMRDVTQAKELELKINNLHEELRHKDKIRGELLREILSIQEEERAKIARELHDETSQVLSSISACLEAAAGTLPDNAEQSKAIIKKAQAFSVTLLDDIHRLIYELRPALLDDLGLVAALRWLVDNSLSTAGISVDFKTTGKQRRLPLKLETTLFRVLQEATTNIVRHAHANNAIIILNFKKRSIAARIKDNGKGFNVEKAVSSRERPQGLGLLGMKERTELMRGTLNIRSQAGCGTEIDIVVPVNNE